MLSSALHRILGAWLRGYRDALTFHGRETRRDFLAFVVLHYALVHWLMDAFDRHDIPLFALSLLTLVATLSYNVRRLHDSNRSGLLCVGYFLFAAPVVIVVSLALAPVDPGNRYGPDPRTRRRSCQSETAEKR
ncbi:DUF805 domain-containing protein [Burkholderia ubonensis]|uniref:DUF805 domain-containing protein n=1 Tax=Burkholderia ubonensis TaxID=101571 RepID=A0AB74DBX6_9BURK|nr:DUF805 domain-containing protein [Burkholderia ubonensis]PAJ76721.1 hypothetical protein CJO71_32400 [Burkholderia ubonensis]PAJ83293.1 hypothetical protein CJO70_33855 [Burkholderia ubonensis]PAJ89287.1 hypothetical protein CJO69_35395 [Burkholderia ubonensis]PAK02586.1 hypothetical protein CJO68_03475 [Burkholderia ubonensis]PAK03656.1 hypothetical protein CJO67_33205 [Burkholderia ubonensis]